MGLGARDGVLLVAHGTVENLDDLPEFLQRIRHGRPASPELIASMRQRYEAIGGSPLLETTRAQAHALARRLGAPVLVGMRLWDPSVEQALEACAGLGLTRVCVLPLAPFSVHVYWSAALQSLNTLREKLGSRTPALLSAPAWGSDPAFVNATAAAISNALDAPDEPHTELIFTAHSLPMRAIHSGDPYQIQVEACARAIAGRLGRSHRLAYQSQGADGGEWLGPGLKAVLSECRAAQKSKVIIAPVGFLADHVETLYDLDIEARAWAQDLGLSFERIPALNVDARFINALAKIAERAFGGG